MGILPFGSLHPNEKGPFYTPSQLLLSFLCYGRVKVRGKTLPVREENYEKTF